MTPDSDPAHSLPRSDPGPVMIIGGAEDKLRDRVILTRFVAMAGGTDSHIAVISTASSLGDAATELYGELFTHMGAGSVSGLRPVTREEANVESVASGPVWERPCSRPTSEGYLSRAPLQEPAP